MSQFWLNIIKPKGIYAKWLIFATLVAAVVFGSLGYFEAVKEVLDTESLTFSLGEYKLSAYSLLSAAVTIALVFWVTAIASEVTASKRLSAGPMRSSRSSGTWSLSRAGLERLP